MNKRAELTTQQLITIIILTVSFSVLLFFIFRLNLGEETKKEICHNSVLLKSKQTIGGALDCRTSYVCISGGDKCDDFSSNQQVVEIDLKRKSGESETDYNERVKNQIMKKIAIEMADCWWMFGEGKVDYIGLNAKDKIFGNVDCALCSVIAFDKTIQEDTSLEIGYDEFYKTYLKNSGIDEKSYLAYLYGTNDVSKFNFDKEPFNFESKYSIITGIGNLGALKTTANWFASGFDAFNAFLAITPKFKDSGYIPVTIKKTDKVGEIGCTEFITKA